MVCAESLQFFQAKVSERRGLRGADQSLVNENHCHKAQLSSFICGPCTTKKDKITDSATTFHLERGNVWQ